MRAVVFGGYPSLIVIPSEARNLALSGEVRGTSRARFISRDCGIGMTASGTRRAKMDVADAKL